MIFSLDPDSTRRRGGKPGCGDYYSLQAITLKIFYHLQDELNLHSTALEAAYLIAAKYKQHWLEAS